MAKPSCNANGMKGPSKPPLYKNKLQEYTQKLSLPFPAYRTANEGFQHAPKFRSTVSVGGVEYTSRQTFRRLREAEQDAAKLAYECIMSNAEQLGTKPLLDQDPKSSKSVLYELAFKKQWDIPRYSTMFSESEGSLPVFISTVDVGGKSFIGDGGKSRREAEQFAARAALQSLLGTDLKGILKNQTMSKKRPYDRRVKFRFTDFKQKRLITNPRDQEESSLNLSDSSEIFDKPDLFEYASVSCLSPEYSNAQQGSFKRKLDNISNGTAGQFQEKARHLTLSRPTQSKQSLR